MSEKLRKKGPIKFSDPKKDKEPEKLINYSSFRVKAVKPNKIKLNVDHGEDRYPPESKPPSSKKYDEQGNYIKHQERIIKTEKTNNKMPSLNNLMRENALGNPSKYNKYGKKK